MLISLRSSQRSSASSSTALAPPAWGTTPVAGDLLVMLITCGGNNSTVPTPTGWIAFPSSPFNWATSIIFDTWAGFYKIASPSETTPAGITLGTVCNWGCTTLCFSADNGWYPGAGSLLQETHTAANPSGATTKNSPTGRQFPMRDCLVIFFLNVDFNMGTFTSWTTGTAVNDLSALSNTLDRVAWAQVPSTTAPFTLATWTTSNSASIALFEFEPQQAPLVYPGTPFQYGGYAG